MPHPAIPERSPPPPPQPSSGEDVVVLGASVAGLLAAHALAEGGAGVVLVERDALPADGAPAAAGPPDGASADAAPDVRVRRGVPQGAHPHALLAAGLRSLERRFPGFGAELAARGAQMLDVGRDTRWWHYGGLKASVATGLTVPFMTRPLLEAVLRARVLAHPRVRLLDGWAARGLVPSPDGARVAGVRLAPAGHAATADPDDGAEGTAAAAEALLWPAVLVVDATGRGSRAAAWLAALGHAQPAETIVQADVRYTSRLYRRGRADLPDGARVAYLLPEPPRERRTGACFPVEGDRWLVSCGGWHGDHAPDDEAGFRAFARALPTGDVADVVERCEPLSELAVHRYPAGRRRHYERLAQVPGALPGGLLVVGDALCSFNPIYGQGMTSAALQADRLAAALGAGWRPGAQDGAHGEAASGALARRFYRRVTPVLDAVWAISAGEDQRYAESGVRPDRATRLRHRLTARVHRAATRDPAVSRAFAQVMHLVRPARALLAPRVLWGVLRHGAPRAAARPVADALPPVPAPTAGAQSAGRLRRPAASA